MNIIEIAHLSTATMLLRLPGFSVVTDPVLDPPGSVYQLGGPLGARATYTKLEGARSPELLPHHADLILLSHDQHRDNLDRAGLAYARRSLRVLTTPAGAARLRAKGLKQAVGVGPWQTVEIGGLTITAVPAQHGPIGTNWLAGDVTGFVLQSPLFRLGPLYITGDTHWSAKVASMTRVFPSIGTVVAHAGAARFGRTWLRSWLRFSMSASEVATLARDLRPSQVLPVHYEGWSHFTEGRRELERAFVRVGSQLRFLTAGSLEPLEPVGTVTQGRM